MAEIVNAKVGDAQRATLFRTLLHQLMTAQIRVTDLSLTTFGLDTHGNLG